MSLIIEELKLFMSIYFCETPPLMKSLIPLSNLSTATIGSPPHLIDTIEYKVVIQLGPVKI